ncbi:HAD family hydrolase [Streptococcus plurextorum]|uniref:HAD family hydrolase n=1 Tax=Streptococcus plurextorum TaxID=456876 RepID=UPI0003F55B0F|nr:HAD family hydrolase [Streptococcus plurextorum]QBX10256.1 putative hydrolase [Streptococcus satellite phage Javan421]
MIEWLFFDLGSTLLDEEVAYRYYIKRCVKKLQLLGIEVSAPSYREKMKNFAQQNLDPIRSTWQYFAPTEPRPLWTNEGVSLYPETIDVLEKLSQNYRLGIVANQSSAARELLKEWGLDLYFQVIILSEEVGIGKPEIRIFKLALEEAGIPADKAVYVGDRYENDILPAKSLGMRTVRILTGFGKYTRENDGWKSDYVVSSLQELLAIF